ncbi:MAG: 4-hydroxybenzoate octaprenyltransferase [Alphaproteobacteria bacterium]
MEHTTRPKDSPAASDIAQDDWIERVMPAPAQPYFRLARIDRPIGTWLLLLPGWWAIALASPGWPSLWFFALFGIGAVVMRGAGCVVNDLADRKFDAQVARTANRPIASGAISIPAALIFLAALLGLGLAILLQFNLFAVIVGAISLALIFPYPLMKRITYWPQAFLGLTFNWGALLGWVAVTGRLDPPALSLYAAGFFWTLGYDTIYAHQDKQDDALIGVKSTALLLAANTRPWIAVFLTITVLLLGLTGLLAGLAWPYYVGLALAAGHLAWQTATVDFENPRDCLKKFKSNRDFGLILLAGIIAGQLL